MIVYVLIRRYYDNSGIHVCGVTTREDIAQAFCAGSEQSSAEAEAFKVDTEEPLRPISKAYEAIKWEVQCYGEEKPPAPAPATSAISDDEIPF